LLFERIIEVIIRTNGGTLTVGVNETEDAKGQIYHYGVLDQAIVYTEMSCFHANGAIAQLKLKAGKAIAEESSILYITEAKGSNVAVEEKGGKFIIPAGVKTSEVSTSIAASVGYNIAGLTDNSGETTYDASTRTDSAYEIKTLEQLETFRDLVNGGFSFAGCVVKLTADIKLNDGWIPIGEGTRKVGKSQYQGNYVVGEAKGRIFEGEFDGCNHTISNLNNKNYLPRFTYSDDVDIDGTSNYYVYGFFGILTSNANIHDLKFGDVTIDSTNYVIVNNNKCKADSVGSLVGFIDGNAIINNISIESGTISLSGKGSCGGGVIGRWYYASGSITLNKLTNKAIISNSAEGGKAAGIVGYANSGMFSFTDCHNINANITSSSSVECYGDLMCCYGNAIYNTNNYSFDDKCSASGILTLGTEDSTKYGTWTINKQTKK